VSWAVVTGAGRGIGRACARGLAARGLDVALLGRTEDDLTAVAGEVAALGRRAVPLRCDVGRADDVSRASAAATDALGGAPRVVVNNAGVVRRLTIEATTEEDRDAVLDANLKGTFLVTRAFLPSMRVARGGRLVAIGSISSTVGTARLTAYCAAKWGVLGFTKALAEELRGSGVQTACVLPGSVDTDMLKGSGSAPQMTPDDVAKVVVWAALDAPDSVHGGALEVLGE